MLENITSEDMNTLDRQNIVQNGIDDIASQNNIKENIPKQKDYIDPYSPEYKIEMNNKAGKKIHETTEHDEQEFINKLNEIYQNSKKESTENLNNVN